jgi:hypothetical protein
MDIETEMSITAKEEEEKVIYANLSHRRDVRHVLLLQETFLDY